MVRARDVLLLVAIFALTGCRTPQRPAQPPASVSQATLPAGLSQAEFDTLSSLEQVADFPLYTMQFYGDYDTVAAVPGKVQAANGVPSGWACSLFTALHDPENRVFGRNFDWEFSPALLLFTDPSDGYASVSIVDIAYLGFDGNLAHSVTDLPPIEQAGLLAAPRLPFDGMNAAGLAVGMAAVPAGGVRPDPDKETIGSLLVIREMLDHAGDVDEAVAILESYNIEYGGGPPLHYLIADRSGRAVLAEFYQGRLVIRPNDGPWHQATNFIRASVEGDVNGRCWRHDQLSEALAAADGRLSPAAAMDLLAGVAQPNTQWSVVYEMSTGELAVAMGRDYEQIYRFQLANSTSSD